MNYYSSKINWCEPDFHESNYIVEYYNSLSNVFFILIPWYMILIKGQKQLIYEALLLSLVGLGSLWFHSTLSLFGQLADEVAILFLLLHGLGWSSASVLFMFIKPEWNAYLLFGLSLVYIWKLIKMKIVLGNWNLFLFFIAVVCWILDKFMCNVTQVYYLHAWWHFFMALVSYNMIFIHNHNKKKVINYHFGLPYTSQST